ncbi:MAG TPA: efflux RND transporter periplasmic adaptor subunit [Bosea sp. (in: a-proteobacteria)]|jgi:HlyD family secretion protein|uniref:efflux RND transporter periplasmic adaptor subunit n=1 Tax=Bosea sp. (in: a-proteobacteria) TaxID=1871050 RepID=UPI002DDD2CF0|nr:efflux RND transporter periplasmic adaptor subunit [Bosea sp. (in: a-proteobacteria)]HEV2554841.1 efflux RND transporter periplasmic adaptor subunit [Bosea sp. (in: a-proteobacteria)]
MLRRLKDVGHADATMGTNLRKWLIGTGVVAVLAAGGYWAWRPAGGPSSEAAYRTAPIDRGQITAAVRATGTLTPMTTVLVGSQLSGQIVEILADYNSQVKAGQVVARLNSDQIRTRRDAAQADVMQARADLLVKRAQLDRARSTRLKANSTVKDLEAQRDRTAAQLADARRTFERQSELFKRNTGSQQALDTASTQVEVQVATLASSEAQIASAKAELNGLDADILLAEGQVKSGEALIAQREAKLKDILIDLERTDIRSPVDGVVVQRQVDLGQTVAASLSTPTLFQIAQDLRTIDIYANVDEADVGRLKAGQPSTFTVNAYPNRTFEGRVEMVRLGAQTIQNVVTYTGVIRVENADMALLPGMTANLQVVTEDRRDVLRIANAALRFRPAGAGALSPAPATPGAAAVAQGAAAGRGAAQAMALRERIETELQPTPEQKQAIAAIMQERRAGFREAMAGLTEEERRAVFRKARADMIAKIAAVLDPERKAKFEAMMQGGRAAPQQGTPGRVYVLDDDGRPRAVPVMLGPTDGAYTELLSGDLQEGQAVVIGGGPRPSAAAQSTPARPPMRGGPPRLF